MHVILTDDRQPRVKSLDIKKVTQDLTLFLTDSLLMFNETVTYRNSEHIPLHLSRTLASVTEYEKARIHIDLEIDRHLKIVII